MSQQTQDKLGLKMRGHEVQDVAVIASTSDGTHIGQAQAIKEPVQIVSGH